MSNSYRVGASSRVPLLVLALMLAAGVALLALEHQRTAHGGPPALTAPAELAPPVAGGEALPVAAPVPRR